MTPELQKLLDVPEEEQHGYFDAFYEIISPSTLDYKPNGEPLAQVPLIKEALIYQLVADDLHVFVCGNPASGRKSTITDFMMDHIAPEAAFHDFSGRQSEEGLHEKMERLREGFMQLDELGFGREDVGVLYDALQSQRITTALVDNEDEVPIDINFYATSNPMGYDKKWRTYGRPSVMRSQMPIPSTLMRRFHVAIFTRPYTSREFDLYNRHKERYRNMDETEWVDPEILDWASEKVVEMRELDVTVEFPEKVYDWMQTAYEFQGELVMEIDRIGDAAHEIAQANARLRGDTVTMPEDWNRTADFIRRTIDTGALDNRFRRNKRKMDG